MLPVLAEATEEHEAATLALFRESKVPVREEYWERAFAAPLSGEPFVVLVDGIVSGYVAVRPRLLHLDGEDVRAQVLHDFIVAEGEAGEKAARTILEELPRRCEVSFAGGWSVRGCEFLVEWRWRYAGPMRRVVVEPSRRGSREEPRTMSAADACAIAEEWNSRRSRARSVFLLRTEPCEIALSGPASANFVYIAVAAPDLPTGWLKVSAREGEILLVDAALMPGAEEAAAGVLESLAGTRRLPIRAAIRDKAFFEALLVRGARELPPRWGVFWTLGSLEHRGLATRLKPDADFLFSPTDFDLDH